MFFSQFSGDYFLTFFSCQLKKDFWNGDAYDAARVCLLDFLLPSRSLFHLSF